MEYVLLLPVLFWGNAVEKPAVDIQLKPIFSVVESVEKQEMKEVVTPLAITPVVIEQPKPVELALEEKIAQNINKCTDLQWIRADNAECIDKPQYVAPQIAQTYAYSGSTAGNGYDYGYCTWYVKNRRADLPNRLGNANQWVYNARNAGFATGSTPQVGAVAQTGAGALGHVAYVEEVYSNGTILVSEMNYVAWGVQSTRIASASAFSYIY